MRRAARNCTGSLSFPEKDIQGLFRPKNKNILAKVVNGELVPIFALVKRAFQPQDSTLLPTDTTFVHNIGVRWMGAWVNASNDGHASYENQNHQNEQRGDYQ